MADTGKQMPYSSLLWGIFRHVLNKGICVERDFKGAFLLLREGLVGLFALGANNEAAARAEIVLIIS